MTDIWDMTGKATRMAIDLGLHYDPGDAVIPGTSALDIDMKRRLFWT